MLFLHPLVVKSYPDVPDYYSFSSRQWKSVIGLSLCSGHLGMLRSTVRSLSCILSQIFKRSVIIPHGQAALRQSRRVHAEAGFLLIQVLHDCCKTILSMAALFLACPARTPFCDNRAWGAWVLNLYRKTFHKMRRLSVAVSVALLGLLKLCKELKSSLGLSSRVQGLFSGCLTHTQAWQDAPAFLCARLMASTKRSVKGEYGKH